LRWTQSPREAFAITQKAIASALDLDATTSEARAITQKAIARALDLDATTSEARAITQKAIARAFFLDAILSVSSVLLAHQVRDRPPAKRGVERARSGVRGALCEEVRTVPMGISVRRSDSVLPTALAGLFDELPVLQ
jgi:hypothetical protein